MKGRGRVGMFGWVERDMRGWTEGQRKWRRAKGGWLIERDEIESSD